MIKTKACRYGTMTYFQDDRWVGRSLDQYGEYSEGECDGLRMMLRPGWTAICVGANVGALAIPMGEFVSPGGKVLAFEPRHDAFDLLLDNVVVNGLEMVVECHNVAVGDSDGRLKVKEQTWNQARSYEAADDGDIDVPMVTIDSLKLDALHLLMADVEGCELLVLKGARETIMRHRPMLYLECDREDKKTALIDYLCEELHYRLYWHTPPLFNPDNFAGEKRNVWGNVITSMLVCIPEESGIEVKALNEVQNLVLDSRIYEREIGRYRRIVAHHPDDLQAKTVIGHYLNLMQRQDESQAMIDAVLATDPNHLPTLGRKALMDLQRGIWNWDDYELRYLQPNTAVFGDRPHKGMKWDGCRTSESVLIWHEQGFGDSIMFGRFIKKALFRAPNAFVEIQPHLFDLFESSQLVPPGQLFRRGHTIPDYAMHCSIPSLPSVLKVGGNVMSPPYLKVDPGLAAIWRAKPHPRIGVCCSGAKISERPYSRDIPSDLLAPLFDDGVPISLENNNSNFFDFSETAGLLMDLDLVITVDTAVAHLGGALGVPTWLLLSFDPDFRWGLKGDRTRWYDSVRIFRQSKMFDWTNVIDELRAALAQFRALAQQEAAE